eukprot:12027122-Heterocapsa_arctica.AAC.1
MHRACVHGVIDLELLLEHGAEHEEDGSDEADEEGRAAIDVAASRSDGHETREDAVAHRTDIVLLRDDVGYHEG